MRIETKAQLALEAYFGHYRRCRACRNPCGCLSCEAGLAPDVLCPLGRRLHAVAVDYSAGDLIEVREGVL